MRTFFQSILGSCLGVLLAILVIFLIIAGIGASFYSSDTKATKLESNSVLHLKLDKMAPELTNNVTEVGLTNIMNQTKVLSIHDYADLIERAAEDKNIKGIYMEVGNIDRKSTRLNSSHVKISYAVFC